ncbi:LCP family protein [Elusimicrobiota bacterium]
MTKADKTRAILARLSLIVIAGVLGFVLYLDLTSPAISSLMEGSAVEVLLMGIDESDHSHRADSIYLVRIDPGDNAIKILQIPRDTLVREKRRKKINSLYDAKHPDRIMKHLAKLLSYKRKDHLWHYACVDYAGFIGIISDLGGFSLPGEEEAGADASRVLSHMRARNAQGDLGRLSSQREIVIGLLQEIIRSPFKLIRLFLKAGKLNKHINTDLNHWEVLGILARARSYLNSTHVVFFKAPGIADSRGNFVFSKLAFKRDLLPVWLGKSAQTGKTEEMFTQKGNLKNLLKGKSRLPVAGKSVKLMVLNSTDIPKLALATTRLVRSRLGLDVIDFGNAPKTMARKSILVNRSSDLHLAKGLSVKLNKELGLKVVHLVAAKNNEAPFTLILGTDAHKLRKKWNW